MKSHLSISHSCFLWSLNLFRTEMSSLSRPWWVFLPMCLPKERLGDRLDKAEIYWRRNYRAFVRRKLFLCGTTEVSQGLLSLSSQKTVLVLKMHLPLKVTSRKKGTVKGTGRWASIEGQTVWMDCKGWRLQISWADRKYLKKHGDLKTIREHENEGMRKTNKLADLANQIMEKDRHVQELECKYNETIVSIDRIMEQKEQILQFYNEGLCWCSICVFCYCLVISLLYACFSSLVYLEFDQMFSGLLIFFIFLNQKCTRGRNLLVHIHRGSWIRIKNSIQNWSPRCKNLT